MDSDKFRGIVYEMASKLATACDYDGSLVIKALSSAIVLIAESTNDKQKAYDYAHRIIDDGQEEINLMTNDSARN